MAASETRGRGLQGAPARTLLALPELLAKSGNKRDPRSDLPLLCGLLFYALTAEPPVTLLDDQLRHPHQRPPGVTTLARFPAELRTRFNRCLRRLQRPEGDVENHFV